MGKKLYVGKSDLWSDGQRSVEAIRGFRHGFVSPGHHGPRHQPFQGLRLRGNGTDQEAQAAIAALNGQRGRWRALTVMRAGPRPRAVVAAAVAAVPSRGRRWRRRLWWRRRSALLGHCRITNFPISFVERSLRETVRSCRPRGGERSTKKSTGWINFLFWRQHEFYGCASHDREPIGAALRRFKKLLERSGLTRSCANASIYEKPCEIRRRAQLRKESSIRKAELPARGTRTYG